MGLLDDSRIDLTCPSCARKFTERIGKLKRDPKLTCPGCGQTIAVEAKGLRTGLDQVDKSLAGLDAAIRRINKG